ncbi:phosphotyrosine interaction domain protein [Oesophagostomum dentatum]|uniref:Phosphotyrosine interaction domain protein n=1 Tax=Oesophagostomum dentatum TaxID=61180 RepID=A0A0B1SGB1_OESDE|nr:phosphotyrosine interaction domain protein [Oesophagostomum dentatum]
MAVAPDGEIQPSTEIDLFISTEKIMVLNTDLQDILMDHALRTISYIADIGDLVVLMARRMSASSSDEHCNQSVSTHFFGLLSFLNLMGLAKPVD